MKNVLQIFILLLCFGCKTTKEVNTNQTYYLLKKNNGLQTIVSLVSPFVYASTDKEETEKIKRKLELKYLRNFPIDFHFDHHEIVCDEEMIEFDKFLIDNYDFTFLTIGFDHDKKELDGQIQYGKQFPTKLTDQDLLKIQSRMNKFHFEIVKQQPNGKSVILMNPSDISVEIRDSEFHQLANFYDSYTEAENYIQSLIEGQFDLKMSYMTVGTIKEEDITDRTKEILNNQEDIRYKSNREDYGGIFYSDKKLKEIKEGMEILMELYESIDKRPYQIVELK